MLALSSFQFDPKPTSMLVRDQDRFDPDDVGNGEHSHR